MNELKELRQRGYDGIADEIEDGLKRWDDGLKSRRTTLAESYLKGDVGLHIHFTAGLWGEDRILEKYCVCFHLATDALDHSTKTTRWTSLSDFESYKVFTLSPCHGRADGEYAMLVNSVQFVQLPEGVCPESGSSVMRLKRLDDGGGCRVNATDLPVHDLAVLRDGSKNRKLRGFDLLSGHAGGVEHRERECQMVERGSRVENTIPDEQSQPVGNRINMNHAESAALKRRAIEIPAIEECRRWLRVWLVDDSVGFGFDPNSGLFFEDLEVFACPLQLEGEAA